MRHDPECWIVEYAGRYCPPVGVIRRSVLSSGYYFEIITNREEERIGEDRVQSQAKRAVWFMLNIFHRDGINLSIIGRVVVVVVGKTVSISSLEEGIVNRFDLSVVCTLSLFVSCFQENWLSG